MPRLVNVGSLCIDHVYRLAELAGPGETVSSSAHQIFPGGKGLNQSLAARRAGAQVHHFGCVGADGSLLVEVLDEAGVDVSGVRTLPGQVSGHAVIQVNDAGENAIVIAGGANRALTEIDRHAALQGLTSDDWLLLQNEINDLPAMLAEAAASEARLAFNVAPVDGRELHYDLSDVDLLIVNEIEARALVSAAAAEGDDPDVLLALASRYPQTTVVLTAGRTGLVFAEPGAIACSRLPAFEVAAVDETAAGDAFIGYLLAELLAGQLLSDALRTASAAGALAVTTAGAAASIPERSAVQHLLDAQ